MNGTDVAEPRLRIHIRWLIRRDMPAVTEIERLSFARPWSDEDFLTVLRRTNCIGMVVELGERVIAQMVYGLHKGHLEVLNFAVHPDFRRRGVGAQMLAKLVDKLSAHRRTRIILRVRETNLDMCLFLKAGGFVAGGVTAGHYDDTGEDAYDFAYRFSGDPSGSS